MDDVEEAGTDTELIPSFLDMFEHVAEQQQIFRALVAGEGVNLVQEAVQKHLCTTFEARFNWFAKQGREIPFPPPALAHYLTGGLMSLLKWWLNAGMTYSPAEINEIFLGMARNTAVS
jgi:hypothetical protein